MMEIQEGSESQAQLPKKRREKRLKAIFTKLRDQMEFYFGDANMHKNRFMKKIVEESPDGYVDIEIFLKFGKIASITDSAKVIADALTYHSTMLEVNADGTKVRRTTPVSEAVNVDERTIYVECLPHNADHEWVKKLFSACGRVIYVSLPRYPTTHDLKGFAFVEFETVEGATAACQTFLWVSHLKGLPKGVLWPAKLVESKSKNESICVYIKCDNAELSVKKANIKEFVVDEMGPLKDKFLNILTKKRRFHTKQQLITDIEWAVNEVKRLDDERDDEGENSKGDDDKVDNEIDENNDTERKRVDNNIDNERKSLHNMTGDEIESYMINSDRDDNCDEDTGDEKDNGRKSGAVKMYDERKKLNKTNVTKKYEVDQRNSDRNLSKSDGCKTDDERNHSDKTVITKKSEVYQRDSERDEDYVPETDDEKESGGYLTDDEVEQYTTDIGRCKDYVPETDDEKESDGHLTDNEIKQYMTDSGRCKDYVPETDDEKESDGQSIDSETDQYMTDSDRDKDYVPDTDDEKESEGNITDDEVYIPESKRVDDYVSETEDEIDNVSDDSNSLPNFLQFIRQEIEDTPRVVGTNQPESEVEKPYQRKLREDQIVRDSKYKNIYIKRYVKSKDGRSGLKSDERPYDTVHACCFCRQLFTHIQDHIEKKHADRSEVKEITELKKKLKLDNDQEQFKKEIKRRQDCLRYSGDHIHNQAVLHSKEGELLIQRKSCTKEDFHVDEYGPCPECQQWIKLESSVKIHQKICPKTAVKQNFFGKKALVWQAKHLIGKVEGSGSNMLRKDVIPKMRKDEISICAQNDHLICNLGDVWLSKSIGHELRKGKDSSFHMRLAAKLLMECRKKLNNSNLDMNDLLTMKNFDTIIEVTLQLCGKNEHDELLHPSTANKIGFDLGRLVGLKYGYCLRQKDTVGKEEADGFLKLMKIDWATKVTTHAGVLLRQRHFENRRRLPHPKDIEIVAKRLSEKLADYNYEQKTMYVQVARTTLLRLMVYNRRRSGEIEELKMETYLRRNKEMDDVEQSLLGELTTTEKYLIKTQELMWIRGKRGKRVPVLIPPDAATALEYIVDPEVRRHAGLKPTNKYMFATKGDGVISASECINELGSEHAGDLIHPNRLTSTGYRAYMATMAQCLGLKDHQVQWLCSHLGHTENVHMTHYRFALDGIERMQLGKLLLIQDKNLLSKFRDTRLEDIEFEDVVSMETETPACANSKQTGTEMDVDAEITVPDFELDADDAVPILDKKAQKKKIETEERMKDLNQTHSEDKIQENKEITEENEAEKIEGVPLPSKRQRTISENSNDGVTPSKRKRTDNQSEIKTADQTEKSGTGSKRKFRKKKNKSKTCESNQQDSDVVKSDSELDRSVEVVPEEKQRLEERDPKPTATEESRFPKHSDKENTGQKKEKRLRTKKEKKEKEVPELRVIPKTEWLKLRKEYLELQKTNMSLLKQSLKERGTGEKSDLLDKQQRKEIRFIPSVIVKVQSKEAITRKTLKESFKEDIRIAYLDFHDGLCDGFIRCDDAESATKLVNTSVDGVTFSLLSGEEEKQYWDKLASDRETKLNTKVRYKKRGHQKLMDKAQRAILDNAEKRHTIFEDD